MKSICCLMVFWLSFLPLYGMENCSNLLVVIPSDVVKKIIVDLDLASTSMFLRTCKPLYLGGGDLQYKTSSDEKSISCGINKFLQESPDKCLSLNKMEYSTVFSECIKNNNIPLLQYLIMHESNSNKTLRIRSFEDYLCDQSCYNDVTSNVQAYNDSIKSKRGIDCLYAAVKNNNFIVAHALLRQGIFVDSQIDGEEITPLCVASINGYADIVDLLLVNDADVEACDEDGCTPLILASMYGYTEVVKALLAKGALINKISLYTGTALLCAVCNGQLNTIKVLLKNGADERICIEHDDFLQWANGPKTDLKTKILTMLNNYKVDNGIKK